MALKKNKSITTSIGNIGVGTSDLGSSATADYFGSALKSGGQNLFTTARSLNKSNSTQNSYTSDPVYVNYIRRLSILGNDAPAKLKVMEATKVLNENPNMSLPLKTFFLNDIDSYNQKDTLIIQNQERKNQVDRVMLQFGDQVQQFYNNPTAIQSEQVDLLLDSESSFDMITAFGIIPKEAILKAFNLTDAQLEDWTQTEQGQYYVDEIETLVSGYQKASYKREEKALISENVANYNGQVSSKIDRLLSKSTSILDGQKIINNFNDLERSGAGVWNSASHGTFNEVAFNDAMNQGISNFYLGVVNNSENPAQTNADLAQLIVNRSGEITIGEETITYKGITEGLRESQQESLLTDLGKKLSSNTTSIIKQEITAILESDKSDLTAISADDIDLVLKDKLDQLMRNVSINGMEPKAAFGVLADIIKVNSAGTISTQGIITPEIAKIINRMATSGESGNFNDVMQLFSNLESQAFIDAKGEPGEGVTSIHAFNFSSTDAMGRQHKEVKRLQELLYVWRQATLMNGMGDTTSLNEVYERVKGIELEGSLFNRDNINKDMGDTTTAIFNSIMKEGLDLGPYYQGRGTNYKGSRIPFTNGYELPIFRDNNAIDYRIFTSNDKIENMLDTNNALQNYIRDEVRMKLIQNSGESKRDIQEEVLNNINKNFTFTPIASQGFITNQQLIYIKETDLFKDNADLRNEINPSDLKNQFEDGAPIQKKDLKIGVNVYMEARGEGVLANGDTFMEFTYTFNRNGTGVGNPIRSKNGNLVINRVVINKDRAKRLNKAELRQLKLSVDKPYGEIDMLGSAIFPAGTGPM